jgi:hypothetical protein
LEAGGDRQYDTTEGDAQREIFKQAMSKGGGLHPGGGIQGRDLNLNGKRDGNSPDGSAGGGSRGVAINEGGHIETDGLA